MSNLQDHAGKTPPKRPRIYGLYHRYVRLPVCNANCKHLAGQRCAVVSPDVAPTTSHSQEPEQTTCTRSARRWPADSADYYSARVQEIIAAAAERRGARPPECELDGCT
jgi:hypothetical protein